MTIAWHGPALTFQVLGLPAPQGAITTYGRGRSVHSNAKVLRPWREHVQHAAEAAIEATTWQGFPLTGPISLHAHFTMPKPKSAPKRRPTWPITRPDLSHLVRAVEDALTASGAWKDDSQVIETFSGKGYPGEGAHTLHVPGVILRVYVGSEAE
jgi:crossover junction endodeoxyribonuclease RusA